MSPSLEQRGDASLPPPAQVFPLIRHLSTRLTPVLARLPVTPNQITFVSFLFGLAAVWAVMEGDRLGSVMAGFFLVLCYVLDNCDGEIARLKNQGTTFGMHFDTFVDWIVHAGFFAGLGYGVARVTGEDPWLWLGLAAAAGGTLNYVIGLVADARRGKTEIGAMPAAPNPAPVNPATGKQWVVFAFRELTRADFCFIVLVLAVFDVVWFLLPAGAIGAQVYWITRFIRGTEDYHV